MIKAVLFDLDNTLIDFMNLKYHSCEAAIQAMIGAGLDMEKDKALKVLYGLYDKYGMEYDRIFQEFLKKTIKKIDYKIISYGILAYRMSKLGHIQPYPNVTPTLIKLKEKGLKLAVVTDAPKLKAWMRLANMRLTDFFDAVVAFEDTGKKKPNKLPFEVAMKQLNARPDECIMVGDWIERDILGAKKLGMKTCYAKYGEFKKVKESGADYEINDIKELLRLL